MQSVPRHAPVTVELYEIQTAPPLRIDRDTGARMGVMCGNEQQLLRVMPRDTGFER